MSWKTRLQPRPRSPYRAPRTVPPPARVLEPPSPSAHPVRSRIVRSEDDPRSVFPAPLFSVSVSVHGLADMTHRFLTNLVNTVPYGTEILLHDNVSDEATKEVIRTFGHQVNPLFSETDVGFGEGQRRNLRRAHAPYFVVVNNDITLPPGWLEKMRDVLCRDPEVAAVGPNSTACKLDKTGLGRPCHPAEADYIEASCMMIRTHLVRQLGLFDPHFEYAYCEDSDLSLRLRRRGWKIAFVDMPVAHLRAQTMHLIEKEGRVDLNAIKERNYGRLRDRWRTYFQTKSFKKRILIKRMDASGDVLMLTPVLRALKARDAHAEITVHTRCGDVLAGNPRVKAVVPSLKADKFDEHYDLDLCYERSPTEHPTQAYARVLGIDEPLDVLLEAFPSKEDRERATTLAGSASKFAVMHPGRSSWPGREWPEEQHVGVAKRLQADGWLVAVVGARGESRLTPTTIDARGLTAMQTAAVIERAGLFVGVDSFPMHLAQAAMVPTVGIFGAIEPKLRLLSVPFFRGVTAKNVPCLGCHHRRPPPLTHGVCDQPSVLCMEQLGVDDVMVAVREVLEARLMFGETSKIRDRVLQHCVGHGIDIGCGRDKITSGATGFDDDPHVEVDVVGDASGVMPFEDGHFDYVYSSHALEDIADTASALREWTRILRSKGNLILQVPNPDHYKGVNLEHVHDGWRPHELSLLVEATGCVVLEAFEDVGPDRYSTVVVARKP